MGVYHLMGLGRSPGTVIGPLTYLAHRYTRWNADDQRFFARSGEARQRQAGEKVGDVQAIVLFTTREVLDGKVLAFDYVDNPPGRIAKGPEVKGGPMKEVLHALLRREWPAISGGRREGTLFWCEVDRRDIRSTYERVVRVVAALAGVGGQGKEMWANLTGGNNVINAALELAAMLSGNVARLYYVQAENQDAEKCVRYTAEDGYWVDLPVMPLAISRVTRAILDLLDPPKPISAKELYGRLLEHPEHWNLIQGVAFEIFEEVYLKPMRKQGLIAESGGGYIVGPQWELVQPYQQILENARPADLPIEPIEALAKQESWLEEEKVPLKF
ncbi:hypothetical protein [uncultured Chloroflexus sp.]|uniref:hypothetical protein n=3 Tax=uncultured Chloroflexus sp. TaxID=214040 RepID=UPI00261FEF54|nr:hypothetical protein [uncultured Chloroflexus sp.]